MLNEELQRKNLDLEEFNQLKQTYATVCNNLAKTQEIVQIRDKTIETKETNLMNA